MTLTTLPGDPPVELTLRRSAATRRFSLRVSRADGRVTLSMPSHAREAEALAFARDKAGWIRSVLAAIPVGPQVVPGGSVMFEGAALAITAAPVRAIRIEGGVLLVPQTGRGAAGVRIAAFLRLAARDRIGPAADRYAAALGLQFRDLALRDTRSRWGSCSVEGRLMFSWRLVMAPPAVLDYVVAHEVAHLAQMNHSPAFWAVVAGLCPGYRAQRSWLSRHGQHLQAVRFTP